MVPSKMLPLLPGRTVTPYQLVDVAPVLVSVTGEAAVPLAITVPWIRSSLRLGSA